VLKHCVDKTYIANLSDIFCGKYHQKYDESFPNQISKSGHIFPPIKINRHFQRMKLPALFLVILLLILVHTQAQWQFKSLRYKVYVKDLEKTKTFYNQILGYEIIYDIDSLCILDPHMDDAVVQFVLAPQAVPPQGSSVLFHVKDVNSVWNRIRNRVNVTTPLRDTRFGRYFAFHDLNGLLVGHYTANTQKGSEVQMPLQTRNFTARYEFYQKTLGMKVLEEWTTPQRGVIFEFGNATRIEVNQVVNAPPAKSVRVSHKIPDVWKLWDRIKNSTRIMYELRQNSWGDDSFGVYDPEGYELELWTRRSDRFVHK
jgi:predicted enzyme related to lactoylglutathione lyase